MKDKFGYLTPPMCVDNSGLPPRQHSIQDLSPVGDQVYAGYCRFCSIIKQIRYEPYKDKLLRRTTRYYSIPPPA